MACIHYGLALLRAAEAFAPAVQAAAPEPRVHQVEITGFAFVPSRIEARAGDVIAFTNRDFAPHTASADSSKWDTGRLKNGASARVVLNYTGTVPCHCELHLHMKGDVVITGAKSVHAR